MINKAELLQKLENEIERHVQWAVHDIQCLPEEILTWKPGPEEWSVAQCLWHLNSYAKYYHSEMEQGIGLKAKSQANYFVTSWLGSWFTRLMQPGKGRFKAFSKHTPPTIVNGAHETSEFIRHQENLLRLIRISAAYDLNAIRIPISISRWITIALGDVFQFLVTHEERHIQQADRVLALQKKIQA